MVAALCPGAAATWRPAGIPYSLLAFPLRLVLLLLPCAGCYGPTAGCRPCLSLPSLRFGLEWQWSWCLVTRKAQCQGEALCGAGGAEAVVVAAAAAAAAAVAMAAWAGHKASRP